LVLVGFGFICFSRFFFSRRRLGLESEDRRISSRTPTCPGLAVPARHLCTGFIAPWTISERDVIRSDLSTALLSDLFRHTAYAGEPTYTCYGPFLYLPDAQARPLIALALWAA
ncbi:hypothetical protein PBRA_000396, partial [Plasmodiophora brassicae]